MTTLTARLAAVYPDALILWRGPGDWLRLRASFEMTRALWRVRGDVTVTAEEREGEWWLVTWQ